MLMSHDYEKSPIPQWALSAMTLGKELASFPNVEPGQKYLNVFLSVPTGQYVAPLIMAGALLAPPKIADPSANVGETFRAVAFDGKSQIRDLDVTLLREDFQGNPKLMYCDSPRVFPTTELKKYLLVEIGRISDGNSELCPQALLSQQKVGGLHTVSHQLSSWVRASNMLTTSGR